MPVSCLTGSTPLLLAFPYVGSDIPRRLLGRLTHEGRSQWDTDWHLPLLFDGVAQDATWLFMRSSRLLADLNALPADGKAPAYDRPGMVALADSRGARLWDDPPPRAEQRRWHTAFFAPYHAALGAQIARLRAIHGHAVLVECVVQRSDPEAAMVMTPDIAVLGRLGLSCDAVLVADLVRTMSRSGALWVDFAPPAEPGWTLRHHGRRRAGVQALQLRIAATSFLACGDGPQRFDAEKAEVLRPVLASGLRFLGSWVPSRRLRDAF